MAAIAEHEAKMISDRTRAALSAAKARGKRLGGFRGRAGTAADCAKARRAKSLAATSRAADLAPVIEDMRTGGCEFAAFSREGIKMIAGFPRHAVGCGQPRRCVLQSPECPRCDRTTRLHQRARRLIPHSLQPVTTPLNTIGLVFSAPTAMPRVYPLPWRAFRLRWDRRNQRRPTLSSVLLRQCWFHRGGHRNR
jgi:hypothetical protein